MIGKKFGSSKNKIIMRCKKIRMNFHPDIVRHIKDENLRNQKLIYFKKINEIEECMQDDEERKKYNDEWIIFYGNHTVDTNNWRVWF